MRNLRAWMGDIMSRLRRFFARGRTRRIQEGEWREATSAEEIPRQFEAASDQQGAGGSGDNPASPPGSTTDSQSGQSDQQVARGSKPDPTPEKRVQPPPAASEAPAPGTSEGRDARVVPPPITDDSPAKQDGPGETADREPGLIVPDLQPAPSPPDAENQSEPQALDVTASASLVESGDLEGRESSLEPGVPTPDGDPTAKPVTGGVESDSSRMAPGAATRSDGEMTATSPLPPPAQLSRRSRRVAPEKRGGRPRGTTEPADEAACAKGERVAARLRSSRPELVC